MARNATRDLLVIIKKSSKLCAPIIPLTSNTNLLFGSVENVQKKTQPLISSHEIYKQLQLLIDWPHFNYLFYPFRSVALMILVCLVTASETDTLVQRLSMSRSRS